MQILDGKQTSLVIQEELTKKVKLLTSKGEKPPHLAAILVGDNGASRTYVNAKVKACQRIGFQSSLIELDNNVTEKELLDEVRKLNTNTSVDGFIVQLPLPSHINENKIILSIDPNKDVDGFHPENIGKMTLGMPSFLPATPNGIMELLKRYEIPTEGKQTVVLGRSNIVGTPISILMSRKNYPGNSTVTLAHSRTGNLKQLCLNADILIVAIGIPQFITSEMIKPGAVVIDVGIHRVEDSSKKNGFKLLGDVDFTNASQKCSFITPVPGGVGPMTIASLLMNTYIANNGRY
ncbi:bifunctional 5,10-methylene-tetrahydrofolate dehydrogenase/5,10-methylene-tetrahydrofolate cyclohydrolase [Flavobacteriales bacterium]|jgi:methylenetetrahydrofolate dehydrogenase (NADP+)/methenyltetrahydrofolate cyclohydrolase|nr:bifunctional 5,10-methylene-tetrahydrofolate dehydrogenase/5,10-methylene-tetrahydrofolate cyclohydrolase [Flavobacteriales bacterium]